MMNFTWHSPSDVAYEGVRWHNSKTLPGVRFGIRKISLASRLQLIQRVRDLCLRHDFLRAGDLAEQSEATLGDLLVKQLYLEWGLTAILGLKIDGKTATTESAINDGPEELTNEMMEQIRNELGLTEQERKNS